MKNRKRSTMKMDLLNSLLVILINDPSLENKLKKMKVVVKALRKYEYMNHCKDMKKHISLKRGTAVQTIINNKFTTLDNGMV